MFAELGPPKCAGYCGWAVTAGTARRAGQGEAREYAVLSVHAGRDLLEAWLQGAAEENMC